MLQEFAHGQPASRFSLHMLFGTIRRHKLIIELIQCIFILRIAESIRINELLHLENLFMGEIVCLHRRIVL